MIVADVTFYPIGSGVSAGKTIKGAIDKLKEGNVKCFPNSMATVIESETMDDLFNSIKNAEEYLVSEGFLRVETIIKIDHRIDVENSVERKIKAIS
ncbi:MAG: MTH1187 family thiamine-binding protein [Cuniculiplasma sp.]